MRIFEAGGPLDPVEEADPAKPAVKIEEIQTPSGGREAPRVRVPIAREAPRGRSLGILLLALADLALSALCVAGVFWLLGARRYLLFDSPEFGTEMSDALTGLKVLVTAAGVLAGGFALSALGVLTLTRAGYRVQMLCALLLCLTLAGIPYGLAVILYLRRSETRARFFA